MRCASLLAAILWVSAGTAEGGGGVPEGCISGDQTNTPGCYKNRSDAELTLLLEGTPGEPFGPPVVCGEVVETPDDVRRLLQVGGRGSSPCARLKRDALATILNIRRSLLLGDGMLAEDGAECFRDVDSFRIVLRCGSIFVPDTSTSDPDDAVTVTEATPIRDLVALANELCELAECPATNDAACGQTIGQLAEILNEVNESRSGEGECPICPGDGTAPILDCPTGVLTFECSSPDGGVIDYRVTATDDCDPSPSVICFPPPGTVLPAGSRRTVECTATDLKGNSSTCSFEVLIVDTTPPSIHCIDGPLVVDCIAAKKNGAIVNFPAPNASDVCDEEPEVACDPPSGSFFPLGTTTVICTATDRSGNSSECSFDVVVVEKTPPELVCSGDIRVECTDHDGATVDYPPPILSASCEPPPDPVCEPPSGSVFPLGTTTVTCSTTEASGAVIECQFTVTVEDTQPPTIVCPQNVVAECASSQGTSVDFAVSAQDVCDPAPEVVCVPPSGSAFPLGSTTVLCIATDASGNSSQCEFVVTVSDTTPPQVVCPQGPIRESCDIAGGKGGTTVEYPAPVAMDACDTDVAVACDPPSGSVFPLGSTIVTCTATDASGNSAQCSFEVIVVDKSPPEVICAEDMVVDCQSPDGAVVVYPQPMVTNECNGKPAVVCEPPSGSLFPIGTTLVTCTATDQSGNESLCTFEVTVADLTPPSIQCPADKIVECSGRAGTIVEFAVTASDTCDPNVEVECNPPSGTAFPLGSTVITCTATDEAGNSRTCEFTVHVVDTTPPAIECPGDIMAECAAPDGAPVTFQVSAIDLCDEDVEIACDPPSGSTFPPGSTVVTCTATDGSGNSSQCEFTITVVDTTPPSIECIADSVRNECDSFLGATIQYPLPGVSDACDPAPEVVCDPPQGTVLPLGAHTITCTATDAAGNTSSCTFELQVVDTAPPELMCVKSVVRECTGPEGAVVEYPLPVVSDTCDPAPNLSCLPASGSVFPIGDTVVTCTADDESGNMVMCEFVVSILDTTPPRIQCPSDIATMCTSPNGTPVSFGVSAVDTCDPEPVVACDPPSGSPFPLGETTVTCTATDRSGNVASCTFTVTVMDEAAPEIVCVPDFEVECEAEGGTVVAYPLPSIFDDCDAEPELVCEPPPGTFLELGPHVIRCTATDDAGNEASCEFTITVVDTTAPMLVCPPNVKAQCEGPGGTTVEYSIPVANDACDGQPPVTCTPPPGSVFPLGQTEVVCTSADRSGNETRCSFFVQVVDTLDPEIQCPEPIVVDCDSAGGTAVEFSVTATDICHGDVEVTCTPPSGTLFPIGQSAVTCEAVDANGNRSQCTFTVTVLDRTPPEITCPESIVALECTTEGQRAMRPAGWPDENQRGALLCTTVVTFDPPVASDLCASDLRPVVVDCQPPSGTRFELGVHTFKCRARDIAGNESTCTFTVEIVAGPQAFIRGEANGDPDIDIADIIYMLQHLFTGGPPPHCEVAADANDDGELDIADSLYLLGFLFHGSAPPPHPFLPFCGLDPTPDGLQGCTTVPLCQ